MNSFDRRTFITLSTGGVAAGLGAVGSAGVSAAETEVSSRDLPLATDGDAIWDLHCHLSGVPGQTVEERAAQLLEYADRMQIQRLIFFMGWPWSQNPTPDDFRRQNDQVIRVLERWPERLFGFAYLNASHPDASLAEIERCIHEGPMVGIKLWVASKCSEEEIDPLIRRCGELNALIYQHTFFKVTGNLAGESTPLDLAQLAARHPEVPLICGHTGGDWTLGIRAIREFPNVSVGIGGSDPTAGFVEMAVRELCPERVVYGSDIGGRSFATQLAKVYGAEITPEERKLILGGNLRRMLKPILQKKGVTL